MRGRRWPPAASSSRAACRPVVPPRAPARPGGGRTPPCRGAHRPPAAAGARAGRPRAGAAAQQRAPASRPATPVGARGSGVRRCSGEVQVLGGQALEARARIALQPADDQRRQRRGQRLASTVGVAEPAASAAAAGSGAAATPRGRRTGSCAPSGARARTPARRPPSRASCPGSSRRTAAARGDALRLHGAGEARARRSG
jgi:hypothetical protein